MNKGFSLGTAIVMFIVMIYWMFIEDQTLIGLSFGILGAINMHSAFILWTPELG